MKKYVFVRAITVEAETEEQAWKLLSEELDNDWLELEDAWAIDDSLEDKEEDK